MRSLERPILAALFAGLAASVGGLACSEGAAELAPAAAQQNNGSVGASGADVAAGDEALTPTDSGAEADQSAPEPDPGSGDPDAGEEAADADVEVEPAGGVITVSSFPFYDSRSTSDAVLDAFDAYGCAPMTDESGPEWVYLVEVPGPGTLIAGVSDGAGVDIDLQILDDFDPAACLDRDDRGVSWPVQAGVYYLVADTFVAGGAPQAGAYDLGIHFLPEGGPCGMSDAPIARIGTDDLLAMPATGKVVKEAHLLTAEEHAANVEGGMQTFPSGWPASFTDHIEDHYAISEAASGYAVERTEPWAPCCEPSNEYGQGSSVKPPAIAEAWYLNMRWAKKPPQGQRYIVFHPETGDAVVAAGGYENGPGDLSRIGGVAEEIHIALGTAHLSTLTFGVALDQALPYGPIDCY